jgi:hypothetical protein
MGSPFLPRLALNLDPPNLQFLIQRDYRCEPLHPAETSLLLFFFITAFCVFIIHICIKCNHSIITRFLCIILFVSTQKSPQNWGKEDVKAGIIPQLFVFYFGFNIKNNSMTLDLAF